MKEEPSEKNPKPVNWDMEDTKLLRAARRIIQLYDLEEVTSLAVKPESIARLIAQELNAFDTAFLRRLPEQKGS